MLAPGGPPSGSRSSRIRARPPGPVQRVWSVTRYEVRWDLKKYWVYLSAISLVVLAVVGVIFGGILVARIESVEPSTYAVTFQEKGLLSGTPWAVSFASNGSYVVTPIESTTGSSLTFQVANGTTLYAVGALGNNSVSFVASPLSGSLTVDGGAVAVSVTFQPAPKGQAPSTNAENLALTAADAQGGNWSLLSAVGVTYSAPTQNTSVPTNGICLLYDGVDQWPVVPAWNQNYSNGLQTTWEFVFFQYNSSSEDVVTVWDGTATNIGIENASCVNASTVPPSLAPRVNSTQAAQALERDDSAFVRANAQASSLMALASGPGQPTWTLVLTTCAPGGGSGQGSDFVGTVNADTGSVTGSSNLTVTCAAAPSPGSAGVIRSGPIHWPPSHGAGALTILGYSSASLLTQLESDNLRANIWLDVVLLMGGFGFSFVIVAIGVDAGAESIAREKDTKTLGALLAQPLGRGEIYLGKLLAKTLLLLALSVAFVASVLITAWIEDGPQANVQWAPVFVLEFLLLLVFFAALSLTFSVVVRRSGTVSGILWGIVVLAVLGMYYLGNLGVSRLPLAYFVPGAGVWLPVPATRAFLGAPGSTVEVSLLPQAFARLVPYLTWGSAPAAQFMLYSIVGLLVDTVIFVVLGIALLRRLEVQE